MSYSSFGYYSNSEDKKDTKQKKLHKLSSKVSPEEFQMLLDEEVDSNLPYDMMDIFQDQYAELIDYQQEKNRRQGAHTTWDNRTAA